MTEKQVRMHAPAQPPALPPEPVPPASRTNLLRKFADLWAFLYFTVFSVVMTWPLALHMRDSIAGQIGDNIYFIFLIRWYEKAWFELGISPLFHPWLNYPQGWNLASTDTSFATTLLGLPASLVLGPTFGYNMAMLLAFTLSGWTMYIWVRRLTGSILAGLVAGTIYAFLPFRMARFLIGHLNLSGTAWFPLYFMGLWDLLRSARGAVTGPWWKSAALAAAGLGLIAFTSMHYLLMTAVISGVFLAAELFFQRKELRQRAYVGRLVARLGAMGVAALPVVILAAIPFFGLANQGGLATRSISYVSMYSASPTDYLLPSTQHWLFGRWVGANFDRSLWIEATLYIGIVTAALALFAWAWRASSRHAPLMRVALVVMAAAFVLSLGTDFHWNNQRVEAPVPAPLQSLVGGREHAPIPMPALLLFKYLPFYSKMRALMRIGFFVLLFASLLAGLGADALFKRAGARRAGWLAALLIFLVFLDFYPGPVRAFSRVEARPVDAWLAAQPGGGAVAQFPAEQLEDQDQVYNTLIHGKPFIGGFFSANQPEQYLRIRPVLDAFPSPEGARLLEELGVQWVLFDTRRYPDFAALRVQVERNGLRYVDTIGDQAVFERK